MGGKNSYQKKLESQQMDTNAAMLDIAKQQQVQSTKQLEQRDKLREPVINQQLDFASGDPTRIRTAAAVPLAQFGQQTMANKANIRQNITGADRDFLMAEESRSGTDRVRQFFSSLITGAPTTLAQLGAEDGALGQNQAGTSLSGFVNSANLTGNLQQQEANRRAQTLSFIGQLFGTAGTLVGAKPWKG